MAYSPKQTYPGATEADPNYPGDKFKDNSQPTVNDGSPLRAIDRNQRLALDEAVMNAAGMDYNGQADTPQDSQMFAAYKAALGNGANLLSNHNFLIPSSDSSQPAPDSTPRSYPAGFEVFAGAFANETTGVNSLTYIDGRVSFSGGDLNFEVPNAGGLEHVTDFVASVADFDGKPRTRGVSFSLIGDSYRVTVGVDALTDASGDDTPLGSVKLEQGSVATRHDVLKTEFTHSSDIRNYLQLGLSIKDAAQAAINDGGVTFPNVGYPWILSGLIIDSNQFAVCELGAIVKIPDGANEALIKTSRFDSLLGTNAWLRSEGVPDSFKINLLVDGNKENQADGTPPPIQIYGKGYESKSIIYNGKGGGFYSACAQKGGQESVEDLPEAQIEIYSYACDDWALEYQGPHDGKVSAYLSGNRDGKTKGALFTSVSGQTNGQCEIGNLHVYGMDLAGIQSDVAFSGGNIICESNLGDNFVLNSSDNLINSLRAFGIRTPDKPQVVINGSRNTIPAVNISCLSSSSAGNLIEVNGNENNIKGTLDGNKDLNTISAALALVNNGSANDIDVTAINCGTAYTQGDNIRNSDIKMHVRNCTNLYDIGASSDRNTYEFTGFDITNAPLSTPSGRPSYTDKVKGVVTADSTVFYFENSGKFTSDPIDMTSTAAQTKEIPHGLPYAPDPGDVSVTIIDSGSTTHEEQYGLRIQFVDDTIIKVGYRLKVAGTGTANVAWRATV